MGAVLAFVLGLLAYGAGVFMLLTGETEEWCAKGLASSDSHLQNMRTSLLPLENTCVFANGTTYAEIPAWLNPTVFACAAIALVCTAAAIRLERRA
ncbi:hypothetical protein [Actinokineospora terrae]|uniref:hypothetical protein n=1 Tax=Actinokineospora terrae TaxID=155974 RepID=UPI000B8233A6|nr:hypothetical protein [Actinokineospora terrae]